MRSASASSRARLAMSAVSVARAHAVCAALTPVAEYSRKAETLRRRLHFTAVPSSRGVAASPSPTAVAAAAACRAGGREHLGMPAVFVAPVPTLRAAPAPVEKCQRLVQVGLFLIPCVEWITASKWAVCMPSFGRVLMC